MRKLIMLFLFVAFALTLFSESSKEKSLFSSKDSIRPAYNVNFTGKWRIINESFLCEPPACVDHLDELLFCLREVPGFYYFKIDIGYIFSEGNIFFKYDEQNSELGHYEIQGKKLLLNNEWFEWSLDENDNLYLYFRMSLVEVKKHMNTTLFSDESKKILAELESQGLKELIKVISLKKDVDNQQFASESFLFLSETGE